MARPRSGVTLCTNDACKHPTRTSGASIQEFPGTRQRVRGLCRHCFETQNPRTRDNDRENRAKVRARQEILNNPPDPATVRSLGKFVEARNNRLARLERMYR